MRWSQFGKSCIPEIPYTSYTLVKNLFFSKLPGSYVFKNGNGINLRLTFKACNM